MRVSKTQGTTVKYMAHGFLYRKVIWCTQFVNSCSYLFNCIKKQTKTTAKGRLDL